MLLLAVPLMTVVADARGGGGHGGGGHGGGFGRGGGHIGGIGRGGGLSREARRLLQRAAPRRPQTALVRRQPRRAHRRRDRAGRWRRQPLRPPPRTASAQSQRMAA